MVKPGALKQHPNRIFKITFIFTIYDCRIAHVHADVSMHCPGARAVPGSLYVRRFQSHEGVLTPPPLSHPLRAGDGSRPQQNGVWGDVVRCALSTGCRFSLPSISHSALRIPRLIHSHRRASMGSTFAARRAGSQRATKATHRQQQRDAGKSGWIGGPHLIEHVLAWPGLRQSAADAPTKPWPIPGALFSFPVSPLASLRTSPGCAPKAMRTPISRVRWATEQDITP